MKLAVISSERMLNDEAQQINEIFDRGLEYFHLRKPHSNLHEVARLIEKLSEEYHEKIVVHYHKELLDEFDVRGLHRSAMNWNSSHNFYSASCHSINEIKECTSEQYVFLSPVFDSISKSGYIGNFSDSNFSLSNVSDKMIDVFALGGVDYHNVEDCKNMKFDGVAVLGAVWNAQHPELAFEKIQRSCLD